MKKVSLNESFEIITMVHHSEAQELEALLRADGFSCTYEKSKSAPALAEFTIPATLKNATEIFNLIKSIN